MNFTASFETSVPPQAARSTGRKAEVAGTVRGTPRLLLRLEAAAVLTAAVAAYAQLGGSWGWFAALFLVPDLSMLGYLAGPRLGAAAYNAGHSYVGAAIVALAAFALHTHALALVAAIWIAHIGFDRLLGYGLKYGTAFGDTHITQLRASRTSPL